MPTSRFLPDFLTVEKAAAVLRIGRTLAYQQAKRFEVTGGVEGLPVVRVGAVLRVPRARLEALAGGPLCAPPSDTATSVGRHLQAVTSDDDPGRQLVFPVKS